MRKIYSLELLRKLHLSRYTYYNEEYDEVYAWYGANQIKIFNYTGTEIGHSNIIRNDGSDYTASDVINERDVHISIDGIVNSIFNEENEDSNVALKDEE